MATTTNFALETPTPGGYRNTWGGTLNTTITKLDELVALAMPLGTIQMYPLATAPTATTNGGTWLICDGSSLVRTTYPDLHTLITNTYGTYPDGDTFLLPDFQARVPVGYNVSAIGSGVTVRSSRAIAATSGGTEAHILGATQIPLHLHLITNPGHIHPVTDVSHYHVGSQTGGKTGEASAVISESEHFHGTFATALVVDSVWQPGGAGAKLQSGSGIDGDILGHHYTNNNYVTGSKTTGLTDSGHAHTLTTDASGTDATSGLTGITTTQTNPIRLSTTEEQEDGDSSHNNMQPYITVQYIILAKHPSF